MARYRRLSGEAMKDPNNQSTYDYDVDLDELFDEISDEQLTELEYQELMEALDTPGL